MSQRSLMDNINSDFLQTEAKCRKLLQRDWDLHVCCRFFYTTQRIDYKDDKKKNCPSFTYLKFKKTNMLQLILNLLSFKNISFISVKNIDIGKFVVYKVINADNQSFNNQYCTVLCCSRRH